MQQFVSSEMIDNSMLPEDKMSTSVTGKQFSDSETIYSEGQNIVPNSNQENCLIEVDDTNISIMENNQIVQWDFN